MSNTPMAYHGYCSNCGKALPPPSTAGHTCTPQVTTVTAAQPTFVLNPPPTFTVVAHGPCEQQIAALQSSLASEREKVKALEAERDDYKFLFECRVQPIERDENGTIRFRQNKIVRFLLDDGPNDMNRLSYMPFSNEDRCQFAQLIGYSVSGIGDLPYADPQVVEMADTMLAALSDEGKKDGEE